MSPNQIYDITLKLENNLPVWPGDPPGKIEQSSEPLNGASCQSSKISASLHWGTHIDAPYHVNRHGWTIDQIPIDVLIGLAQVIEIPEAMVITAAHLQTVDLGSISRVLFKTRNSDFWDENPLRFHEEFTALSADAAELLLRADIRLVGIDYFSIDLFEEKMLPVHQLLYAKNIVGIENLDLREINAGTYNLMALPIKISGGDGAPARALLEEI
jgi:arylformamidase